MNSDDALVKVNVAALKSGDLAIAKARKGCHQNHHPESRRYEIREPENLRDGQDRTLRGRLGPRASDATRIAADQLVLLHGSVQDRAKEPVSLGHRKGCDGGARQQRRQGNSLSNETCEVIITAPDEDWLVAFTRHLVDRRLAAAGQIIPSIRSIYRWEGVIHETNEARVALHTRVDLVEAILAETSGRHPYEVPCVIALPIRGVSPDYQAWILEQTNPAVANNNSNDY